MNENVTLDSLALGEAVGAGSGFSFWMVLGLCVVCFIVGLLLGKRMVLHSSVSDDVSARKKEVKNEKVDFDNVIGSAFDARDLAKKLKIKCHPDRFPGDEEKRQSAEALHQEVEENSRNLKVLTELEKRIQEELYG